MAKSVRFYGESDTGTCAKPLCCYISSMPGQPSSHRTSHDRRNPGRMGHKSCVDKLNGLRCSSTWTHMSFRNQGFWKLTQYCFL